MKTCTKCNQSKPLVDYYNRYSKCKSCVYEHTAVFRVQNAERIKEQKAKYWTKNKDSIKKSQQEWKVTHPSYFNDYYNARLRADPFYKYCEQIRTLIRRSLQRGTYTSKSKTYKILGCSYEDFTCHVEQQFAIGMSWDNRNEWHLDHIMPLSLAQNEAEFDALNHYSNFQPLWADDNLSKGDSLNWQKCPIKYPNQI